MKNKQMENKKLSYIQLRKLLLDINVLFLPVVFQRDGETNWIYEFVIKSHGFPQKLRYKIYQDGQIVLGAERTLQADSPDEIVEKLCNIIFDEQSKIDIYEFVNDIQVWGNYSHYVGIWKYDPTTITFQKQKEKGQGFYDPGEDQ